MSTVTKGRLEQVMQVVAEQGWCQRVSFAVAVGLLDFSVRAL